VELYARTGLQDPDTMTEDEELEYLRQKRLRELQAGQDAGSQEEALEAQRQQIEAQKQALLRTILEPEARERLGRLKMARPDFVNTVEQQILLLSQRLPAGSKIDDGTLKQLISKMLPRRKDIKIERR
jgi:programmed cell death protein 5